MERLCKRYYPVRSGDGFRPFRKLCSFLSLFSGDYRKERGLLIHLFFTLTLMRFYRCLPGICGGKYCAYGFFVLRSAVFRIFFILFFYKRSPHPGKNLVWRLRSFSLQAAGSCLLTIYGAVCEAQRAIVSAIVSLWHFSYYIWRQRASENMRKRKTAGALLLHLQGAC